MSSDDYLGLRWWKMDFHAHTQASTDYQDDKTIVTIQQRLD